VNITLDDGSYYLGIWYVPPQTAWPEAAQADWLASVWRATPGGVWQGETRLRFYGGAAPDRKQWSTVEWPAATPEHEVLTALSLLAGQVGTEWGQAPVTVLIQGDGRAAEAALGDRLAGYATFTERPA
jgi:hypothetical protein